MKKEYDDLTIEEKKEYTLLTQQAEIPYLLYLILSVSVVIICVLAHDPYIGIISLLLVLISVLNYFMSMRDIKKIFGL